MCGDLLPEFADLWVYADSMDIFVIGLDVVFWIFLFSETSIKVIIRTYICGTF